MDLGRAYWTALWLELNDVYESHDHNHILFSARVQTVNRRANFSRKFSDTACQCPAAA